jgi:Rrf2 family protein
MRIELTRRGDYAVRAGLVLARAGGRQRTGAEIAAEAGIPPSFVPHVMRDLTHAGIAATRRGRHGGYVMAVSPERVTLLDVIQAAEGDARRQTCVLRGGPCGKDGFCDVHQTFFAAQEALLTTLRGTTLAGIVAARSGTAPMRQEAG